MHCGDGRHLSCSASRLLAPHHLHGTLGFHHRDALAVDRSDQQVALFESRPRAPGVEGLEVTRRVEDDLLGAALWDRDAGELAHGAHRLVEGSTDRSAREVALDVVAERTSRQAQLGIEGMDAFVPRSCVAKPAHRQLADDRHDRAGMEPLVCEANRAVWMIEKKCTADVTG